MTIVRYFNLKKLTEVLIFLTPQCHIASFIDKFSATRWFKDQKYLEKRKANIADADIYIHPSIGYNIKDYDALKICDMIKIGYNACRKDDIASKLEALK